jgi:hypothetical protein
LAGFSLLSLAFSALTRKGKTMLDPLTRDGVPEILPVMKLSARVAGLFHAPFDHFETRATEELRLGFEGIEGDFHAGYTRRSGGREPWYPRGTEMRNERQLRRTSSPQLRRAWG